MEAYRGTGDREVDGDLALLRQTCEVMPSPSLCSLTLCCIQGDDQVTQHTHWIAFSPILSSQSTSSKLQQCRPRDQRKASKDNHIKLVNPVSILAGTKKADILQGRTCCIQLPVNLFCLVSVYLQALLGIPAPLERRAHLWPHPSLATCCSAP